MILLICTAFYNDFVDFVDIYDVFELSRRLVDFADMYGVLATILLTLLVFTAFWHQGPRGIVGLTPRGGPLPEGQTRLVSAD